MCTSGLIQLIATSLPLLFVGRGAPEIGILIA